jgi:magnesium transporter
MNEADVGGLPLQKRFDKKSGSEPAKPAAGQAAEPVRVTSIDYSPERAEVLVVEDLADFLGKHRPEWVKVRWINVDGLTDASVIDGLAKKYDLHPLAIEDVRHVPQRPKVDFFGEPGGRHQARLFIIAQMIELTGNRLQQDQISIFVGHNTVITFQHRAGDVWGAIRQRIQTAGTRLRSNDAGFLAYSLIDAIVDNCFPILERYGDELEVLEQKVLRRPGRELILQVHKIRRDLMLLRRAVWPMREVVNTLGREPHECLAGQTRLYLRDVYDHVTQAIDIIETYRDIGTGITETHMSAMSNRLNETIKVLTLISVVFIPVTFLSSLFGMNFTHFPWGWPYAFDAVALGCVALMLGMLAWFKRRGWIG